MKTPTDNQTDSLPDDFENEARQRFERLDNQDEITFDNFLAIEKSEFQRQKALEINPSLRYTPSVGTITPCGNGDFEKTLDSSQWQGAYGQLPPRPYQPFPFANFTDGIVSGLITQGLSSAPQPPQNLQAHQSWVGTGNDTILASCIPPVTLPTTAQGSSGAVRIGNAVHGCGCELLSKTFIVTPAANIITFWYAVVLQNPDPTTHAINAQPYFMVRVTDAFGNIVPGAFNFNNSNSPSPDTLIADTNNPFFQTTFIKHPIPNDPDHLEPVVYKDWSCAQIDLSTQIGQQVTIEFVTGDCGHCGHWGYAYIDNFCGDCSGSPTGNIEYDCSGSTHCGQGQICIKYDLPTATVIQHNNPVTITGSVTISLGIYQAGNLLTTLTSPTLIGGSSYCFNVTPTAIPGINIALMGFDFVATGTFSITHLGTTTNLGQMAIGSVPNGLTNGQNNDYQIVCKTCAEIEQDQNAYLSQQCENKFNFLPHAGTATQPENCHCDCRKIELPKIEPCITVKWGDSKCDCLETDDMEVLCITVCNCYSNVTFNDFTIGHIQVTDMAGNPVPTLPNGTPSVQVIPSGPICFGNIKPCGERNQPSCVSREFVLKTCGAIGQNYRLTFEGVCFNVCHEFQSEQCFVVELCQD